MKHVQEVLQGACQLCWSTSAFGMLTDGVFCAAEGGAAARAANGSWNLCLLHHWNPSEMQSKRAYPHK